MERPSFRSLAGILPSNRKESLLFFGCAVLFFTLFSVSQVAFSPGTETIYDSSSINNREVPSATAFSGEIFAFEELDPKESAPPESSVSEKLPAVSTAKKKAVPSKITFAFRPDAVRVDENLVTLLRSNLNARAFQEKVTPISVTVDSERTEPRGQLSGNELIIASSISGDSEKIKVFVHELGHVVDIHYLKAGILGDPSDSFYAISWDSYKVKKKGAKLADFVSGYALSNKYEDFAESFSYYVFHNAEFKDRAKNNGMLAKKYEFFAKKLFTGKEFLETDFGSRASKAYFWDTTKVAIDTKKYLFYIR